jgi:protoporphyrinogen oxidase
MDSVEYLVVGAGMTGLSFANAIREEAARRSRPLPEVLVLEADTQPGGYCKTIKQDGFVWDYSGHFFHFKHPEIEAWLRARMPGQDIREVEKRAFIRYAGRDVDFPFQKNIHQLPREDFIDCLHDLWFRDAQPAEGPDSFKRMLYRRFGRGIAEAFLVPYNEKLYACDLDTLDVDAMGRFFPKGDADDIVRNMKTPDNRSYNSTFTYPLGGAIEYVKALLHDLPEDIVSYEERLERVDLARQVAVTNRREIRYRRLVTSAPLPHLLRACGVEHDASVFSWNKVLVFNLGFDGKGHTEPHWMYFPDRSVRFYRVGWYDNIMGADRMSLYVEIGAPKDATFDVEAERARVLADLEREGVVRGQRLVSWHHVVLDPAYVHVSRPAQREQARWTPALEAAGVFSVGRYGGWTYCSIEDNLVQTRALAARFGLSLT